MTSLLPSTTSKRLIQIIHYVLTSLTLSFHQLLFDKYKASVSSQPWGGKYKMPTAPESKRPRLSDSDSSGASSVAATFARTKHRNNHIAQLFSKLRDTQKGPSNGESRADPSQGASARAPSTALNG